MISAPYEFIIGELVGALDAVESLARRNICAHEDTHRGGAIWEICDLCGAKWADDEGGKPEFREPVEFEMAEAVRALVLGVVK